MESFGKYQAVRQIGAGGFGVVYEGFDPAIRRRVAIKTCVSTDATVRGRFAREVEITGNLRHANIPIVFDYGEQGGVPFLVQEFLDGEDLDRAIGRRTPWSVERKVEVLRQVAEALAYAHRQDVVHRDVKPSNVRILSSGVVKVMDFGIARLKNDVALTATGQTVGTAAYMAPEQLRGEALSRRSDIFSFGATAYELLTLERAFDGFSISEVLLKVMNQEPRPIQELCSEVPAHLAAAVARCYRKSPQDRFASLDELLASIQPPSPFRPEVQAAPSRAPAMSRQLTLPTPRPLLASSPERAPPRPEPTPERPEPPGELFDAPLRHRPTPAPTPPVAASAPPKRFGVGLAALIVVLAVAIAGGVLWRQARSGGGPPATGAAAMSPVPREVATSAAGDGGVGVAATPARASSALEPAPAAAIGTESVPAPDRSSVGPTTAATGELLLPLSWSPRLEISIDGGAHLKLDRERSIELPAGTHRLHFRLDDTAYTAEADAEIEVTPGGTASLPIAITKPGALTVRAALSSRRAEVWLDGRLFGRTPLQRVWLTPGRYQLELRVLGGGATFEPRAHEVEVRSGEELVLTADPDRDEPPSAVRKLADYP